MLSLLPNKIESAVTRQDSPETEVASYEHPVEVIDLTSSNTLPLLEHDPKLVSSTLSKVDSQPSYVEVYTTQRSKTEMKQSPSVIPDDDSCEDLLKPSTSTFFKNKMSISDFSHNKFKITSKLQNQGRPKIFEHNGYQINTRKNIS
jgi:hypothetical protein